MLRKIQKYSTVSSQTTEKNAQAFQQFEMRQLKENPLISDNFYIVTFPS